MINDLDIQWFYKLVENKYTFVHDCCEIEQTLDAMRSYIEYPLYEKWEIEEHDYNNGSWKLKYNEEVLTADIITPIGRAIRKYLKKRIHKEIGNVNVKGIHIVNAIVDNPHLNICIGGEYRKIIFEEKIDLCEIRAFALVVYWIGNMMPVSKNPSTGRGGENDDWHYKMQYILDIIYGKEHTNHQWDEWIKKWSDKNKAEEFINGNYLQDMFSITDKEFKVKDDNEENWFINNTKLIIQRSYRIVHKYNGSWNEASFEPVREIIKTIFLTAKIPEEKIEEQCKTWF